MNILLSIKPKYVEAIAEGRKSYEFRKSIFRNESVERVYLYSTQPVGKIVGSFKVGRVTSADTRLLWETLGPMSGVTSVDFFDYFKNTKVGFAIEIIDLQLFRTPVNPGLFIQGFKPPRSFMYIDGQLSSINLHTNVSDPNS
jgi:type I restriction enzyme S subunit